MTMPIWHTRRTLLRALALPGGMERYRRENVERWVGKALVRQALGQPVGKLMPQVIVPLVLEAVDEVPHHGRSAVGRHGAGELGVALVTIRTKKIARDGSGKRLGTPAAVWRHDATCLRGALCAEVRAGFGLRMARCAVWRVE